MLWDGQDMSCLTLFHVWKSNITCFAGLSQSPPNWCFGCLLFHEKSEEYIWLCVIHGVHRIFIVLHHHKDHRKKLWIPLLLSLVLAPRSFGRNHHEVRGTWMSSRSMVVCVRYWQLTRQLDVSTVFFYKIPVQETPLPWKIYRIFWMKRHILWHIISRSW